MEGRPSYRGPALLPVISPPPACPLTWLPRLLGMAQYLPLLASEWPAVTASVVGSAVVAIAATGLTMRVLQREPDAADR